MSGFQIPGLGQAKPNEVLPPAPTDTQTAQTGDEMNVDVPAASNDQQHVDQQENGKEIAEEIPQQSTVAAESSDSMMVDTQPETTSLTAALEAAIAPAGQPAQQTQSAPEAAPEEETGGDPEFELDSSPYESSSDSSSSDSSDDDDSDNEPYELLGVEETARLLMEAEGGSDDDGDRGGKSAGGAQVRTKNEQPEEYIPRPDVTITEEMKVEELGSIQTIVDTIALVKAITPGEYQVLDTGSVLCTADRRVIGVVSETIGKVIQPLYTIRFNTPEEPAELGLAAGTKIFYPADHANYVFTEPLKNLKGSDASNIHDEEVGDDEMEFSDDEKEAEYKRSLKQKKREKWKSNNPGAATRGGKDPHPLRQATSAADGGLNYDEDDDGPYKPLTRPPGFGNGPVSTETYDPSPRGGFRGRRGDGRGRGGRGRGGRGGRGGSGGAPREGYSLPPQGQAPGPSTQPQGAQPYTQAAPPPMSNFGFQVPGWPQAPQGGQQPGFVPPPPPGWQVPAQGQAQLPASFSPAFLAALMTQMQNGQQGWGGQQQQQQPPPGQ